MAEAAFQDKVWGPSLGPLAQLADVRVIQCHAEPLVARERIRRHALERMAHADAALLAALDSGEPYFETFRRVEIGVPAIDVDTTYGYRPSLDALVGFANADR